MRYVRLPSWGVPLILVVAIGLGANAAVVPESPGRWQVAPDRAVARDSARVLSYLDLSPRVGTRISTSYFVALAEGENAWAATYLARQHAALDRAAGRLPSSDLTARRAVVAVDALLDHEKAVLAASRGHPLDPFRLAASDDRAMQLRREAEWALGKLESTDPAAGTAGDGSAPGQRASPARPARRS